MSSDFIRQFFDKQAGYSTSGPATLSPPAASDASKPPGVHKSTSDTLRQLFDRGSNTLGAAPSVSSHSEPAPPGQPGQPDQVNAVSTSTPFRTLLKVSARRHAASTAVSAPSQPSSAYAHLRFNKPPAAPTPGTGNDRTQPHLRWSYELLYDAAGLFAAALYDAGVRHGHVVAVLLTDGVELALLFWACMRIGAVFLPLDPKLLRDTPRDLGRALASVSVSVSGSAGAGTSAAVVVADGAAAQQWDAQMSDVAAAAFHLRIVAQDIAKDATRPGWVSTGSLLRIWELNADYIVKNVDAEAAQATAEDGVVALGDQLRLVPLRNAELVAETNAMVAEREGRMDAEEVIVSTAGLGTRAQLVRMAAAFRMGDGVEMGGPGIEGLAELRVS